MLVIVGELSLICCTSMAHAANTKIWEKIISVYAKKCSITGFSSLRGGGGQKTQVYMPSRGMNAWKSDLMSDPDVGKTFKYHAQHPGVMQGGPRANFRANILMKMVGEFSLICCTSMAHAENTKIWAKIISTRAPNAATKPTTLEKSSYSPQS